MYRLEALSMELSGQKTGVVLLLVSADSSGVLQSLSRKDEIREYLVLTM
jgi:hypothetical protein